MCGISGVHSINNIDKLSIVEKMNRFMIHRGPDKDGFFSNSKISLGMQRLSIIDLTSGNQPIFSDDKSKAIIFNGEIYNYKNIRTNLQKLGIIFKTNSDTEVILKSYIQWGPKCLDYFRGMFAFAIYDMVSDELFIARDAFGEKPLYYSFLEGNFIFSSELRSILSSDLIPRKISKEALDIYLQLSYIPAPNTIIENVKKLEQGHHLYYKNGHLIIKKWFEHYEIKRSSSKNKILKTLIEDSVKSCLVSDVPVGVFLSGGIDSSIIAYHAASNIKGNLNSFTLGFSNKEFDESKRAQFMSKSLKINNHLEVLDEFNTINSLKDIISRMDEPISDSSFIATFKVSKLASQNVKVVLTGDGGDEIFGGYDKYLINKICDIYNIIPKTFKVIIDYFVFKFIDNKSTFFRKYKKIKFNSYLTKKQRIIQTMIQAFSEKDLNQVLLDNNNIEFSLDFLRKDIELLTNKFDLLTSSLLLDQKYTLEGCMLQKVDRASMLNSLETRSPFLNIDLVRYVNGLNSKHKIRLFSKKHVLKNIYKNIIPRKILLGRKRGFSSPISYWIKKETFSYFSEYFDENFISKQNIFNFTSIIKIMNEHISKLDDHGNKLWNYIVFQNWYKINILK